MKYLNDLDPMPFGKFRGRPMQDVPGSYFHWLWVTGKDKDVTCPVHHYIKENIDHLKVEHPDGIWE